MKTPVATCFARLQSLLIYSLLAVVLAVGGWVSWQRGVAADRAMRNQLLSQSIGLARTINPSRIRALAFTAADRNNPAYQQIREQMIAYGQALGLRSIYSQVWHDGKILFGPENLETNSPYASVPGTVYEKPTQQNRQIFQSGEAYTEGPYTDEYGTFVSAFSPVTDPRTGKILLVIGLDMEASDWNAKLWRRRLPPAFFTLFLAAQMLASCWLVRRRAALGDAAPRWTRHLELGAVALVGLTFSLGLGLLAHEREINARREIFSHVAESRAGILREVEREIRDSLLAGVARFLTHAPDVSAAEFHRYADSLAQRAGIHGFAWAPGVPAEKKEAFEAQAQAAGCPGFHIFERSATGESLPVRAREVYYPVLFAEPLSENVAEVGFDLASEPVRRTALEQARQSRLSRATDPISLPLGAEKGMLVYHPVYGGDTGSLSGFAVAVVQFRGVLQHALSESEAAGHIALVDQYQLRPDAPPCWLTAWPDAEAGTILTNRTAWLRLAAEDLTVVRPLFFFGQSYALVIRPGPAFLTAHPGRDGWITFLMGCLLTAGATVFTRLVRGRHERLEREVRVRTESLRASEASYRSQFADNRAVMLLLNPETGQIADANAAAVQFYGYPYEVLQAMTISQINNLPPSNMQESLAAVQTAGRAQFQSQQRLANGEARDVEVYASRIWFGEHTLLHAIIHDVTERKRAERHLAEALKELKALKVALDEHSIVAITDPQGKITYVNDKFCVVSKYRREEILGQDHSLLNSAYHPKEFIRDLWTTISQGRIWKGEVMNRAKDGSFYWVDTTIVPFLKSDGKPYQYVAIRTDITEIKQAEAELLNTNFELSRATQMAREMALEAELASAAKSQFLANMSHEIRTPMNGIIGMTNLLLDSPLNAEQRQFAQLVRTSGNTLLSLISDILDFSKIEAGKLDLEMVEFDLRSAVEDVVELLAIKAAEKQIALVCEIAPGVPTVVCGDPTRLRQILFNLGGNAIKFTSHGDVVLRVTRETQSEKSAMIRVTVQDSGVGIPSDRQHLLFTPFSQADASTTRKFGGTGLGLAISKQLVEKMGGRIGVESETGQGATFWFTIMVGVKPAPVPAPVPGLGGKRVLVVDPHPASRCAIAGMLTSLGCRVTDVENKAAMPPPAGFDVLLVDKTAWTEPFPVARTSQDCRVVLMTPIGDPITESELTHAGVAARLFKPFRLAALHACLTNPAVPLKPAGTARLNPAAVPAAESSGAPWSATVRVLVCDDHYTNRLLAVKLIERRGGEAVAVSGGQEALEALGRSHFDLVLMDCQMPQMDGFEATRRIRNGEAGESNRHIAIVALTANAMASDRAECLRAGMDDFITKPVEPERLNAVIESCRSKHSAGTLSVQAKVNASIPAPRMKATTDVFNRDSFMDRMMGDDDLARTIAASFLSDLPRQVSELCESVTQNNCDRVRELAHRLKGAAGTVGGDTLKNLAGELEEIATGNYPAGLQPLLPRLETDSVALHQALTQMCSEPPARPV